MMADEQNSMLGQQKRIARAGEFVLDAMAKFTKEVEGLTPLEWAMVLQARQTYVISCGLAEERKPDGA